MNVRDVTLFNAAGERLEAEQAVCENCGGEAFYLLWIVNLPHTQCVACEQMYCDPANECSMHAGEMHHDDA